MEMVTKSTVALAATAFILVFVGVSWYLGSLPQITQKLSEGLAAAKNVFQPIINAFNSIPSELKMILVSGIAGAVSLFMMWTKTRAITKLQQTEQQAAAQATQLTGELTQAQTTAGSTLTENMNLKNQLAVYEKDGDAVTALKEINVDLQGKIDGLEATHKTIVTELTTQRDTIQRDFQTVLKLMFSDPNIKKNIETQQLYDKYVVQT